MNKGITKSVLIQKHILTPQGEIFKSAEDAKAWNIFPCVVKPCSGGSSVGITIAQNADEYKESVAEAFSYGEDEIVVEEYIKGREFSVGLLGGKALPPIEIIPNEGFYDYKNKYQDGLTTHVCPAQIEEEDYKKCQKIALKIFKLLRMTQYGRIDMMYDDVNHEFWFIEANNLPGMTNTSLLPEAAKANGISYEDLVESLVLNCGRD